MENKDFIFQISAYNIDCLLPQVSKALKKRTELVSREHYPGLWKKTDKLNDLSRGRTRSRAQAKITNILYLALGIFLFIPGLMKPQELLIPLLAGCFAIVAGICGLWQNRKRKRDPFEQSARLLLQGKDILPAGRPLEVSFSSTSMMLPSDTQGSKCVPYSNFECMIETADIFLMVYDTRVTVLQKKDLATGRIDDFRSLMSQSISKYHSLM